jgi:hypothetical protein
VYMGCNAYSEKIAGRRAGKEISRQRIRNPLEQTYPLGASCSACSLASELPTSSGSPFAASRCTSGEGGLPSATA